MLVQDRIDPFSDPPKNRKSLSKNLDFSTWASENLYRILIFLLLITTVAALFYLRNYSTSGSDAAALLCLQSTQSHIIHPKLPDIDFKSVARILDKVTPFSNFQSEKWIVVSVSDYPSDSLKKLSKIKGWQVLAVGNSKTPKDWSYKGIIFIELMR